MVAANFAGGGGRINCNPRLDSVYHPLGTTLMHVAAAAGFVHVSVSLFSRHHARINAFNVVKMMPKDSFCE